MTNRSLALTFFAVVGVLSLSLLHTAYTHQLWREFVVTEVLLFGTAVPLWFMLRGQR